MKVKKLRAELLELADAEIAAQSQRFFKTGPGEYGERDEFIGIRMPVLRKLAKGYVELSEEETAMLVQSRIHEERLLALLILVYQFEKADAKQQSQVFDFYRKHLQFVNNWDLVDSSAHIIVGGHLRGRSRRWLYRLAKSRSLWKRRVSIISTYHFIKRDDFDDTLQISQMLVADDEDLIHKAVGWMLREVGNRDRPIEEAFLKRHYKSMPRTMLRYAIEKFPQQRRKQYLTGKV